MTWKQILFTWVIPILPLCFAWDGAVSNIRTYTISDMEELLDGWSTEDYRWEMGSKKGKVGNSLFLLGMPL